MSNSEVELSTDVLRLLFIRLLIRYEKVASSFVSTVFLKKALSLSGNILKYHIY